MEPLKPETKRSILQSNPQADPVDIEEYERLLAERFTVDPSLPAAPMGAPTSAREARLAELHRKLFPVPAQGARPRRPPTILVLDFDGVLCDGMREYFGASWRTYERLWGAPSMSADDLFPRFSRLRPVVETGWEMPVVLRALMAGKAEADLLQDWNATQHLDAGVTREQLGQTLDRVREEWIREDQAGWLASHRFYPGVIERVQKAANAGVHVVIATTKEGKFARLLVESQGLKLPAAQVLGKEARRPKQQVLRETLAQARERGVAQPVAWFVEDRLDTLRSVANQTDLADVGLFLAAWGYNLLDDRKAARGHSRVRLLTLEGFAADFSDWP